MSLAPETADFELAAYLEQVPAGARVRALTVLNSARRATRPLSNQAWLEALTPFEWIPKRDYVATLFEAGVVTHPELAPLVAVRRHARGIYPTFCETLVGQAVFAALRREMTEILPHISIAYSSTFSDAEVRAISIAPRRAVLSYDGLYGLPGNQIAAGALDGLLALCGNEGTVEIEEFSASSGEVTVVWS